MVVMLFSDVVSFLYHSKGGPVKTVTKFCEEGREVRKCLFGRHLCIDNKIVKIAI